MNTPDTDELSRYFRVQVIDDAPRLLEESYRLRYQVYCLERLFLPAGDYPNEMEIDSFDEHSVHIGVLDLKGEVIGTARLIQRSAIGLPMFDHCELFPNAPSLNDSTHRIVEAGRLAMSRNYNRRAGDEHYGLQGATGRADGSERRKGGIVALNLFKALYQASKRNGFTHWLAATERSLQRLMVKYGFPFNAIGPETDYYGCVSPYLMDLREFDQVILSGRIPMLEEFLEGLEPEFRPVELETSCLTEVAE